MPTDGDGCYELVVGYTDRVVRAFRWEELAEGPEHLTGQLVSLKKWMLEGQVRSRVWGPTLRASEQKSQEEACGMWGPSGKKENVLDERGPAFLGRVSVEF